MSFIKHMMAIAERLLCDKCLAQYKAAYRTSQGSKISVLGASPSLHSTPTRTTQRSRRPSMKTDRREIHERVSTAVAQAVKLVGPVNQTNAPVIRKIARQLLGIALRSQPGNSQY
jgi:hypothetical protein